MTEEIKYSIPEIEKFLQGFIATKGDFLDEWYTSEKSLYSEAIEEFIEWVKQDDEREQRRKLYEELKKEFEGK